VVLSLFIIGHMGLFFYNKIGSIISIGDLPTTNIIEPIFIEYKRIEKSRLMKGFLYSFLVS
ncbi:hypothetical protein RQ449_05165, partial [Streptococcus pneumoniae]|nr:hypothetical protein [Streptococcus pneumoniae]MDS4612103.1 hypothetical protein [Streptococcus pneumoniae]MDS4664538.1 hypothetical protein [Streptococcus pneumoniae]MDS5114960.1 hypothetical protein [Streptococcus pneumoniae]MDT5533096.1 hypothetical protein [Streptococcus pneumoniae]